MMQFSPNLQFFFYDVFPNEFLPLNDLFFIRHLWIMDHAVIFTSVKINNILQFKGVKA